ncbi:MAG: hypothetical protein ACXVA9_14345 [Bdellovibrionales bacterium]
MNRFLVLLVLLGAVANASEAETPFTYKGACMVYVNAKGSPLKTLANMDVELSKAAKVLYKKNGYSFEVEQTDMMFPDEGGRVEHALNLRIMKNGEIVTWTMAEIGNSKNSGAILISGKLPVISCARGE